MGQYIQKLQTVEAIQYQLGVEEPEWLKDAGWWIEEYKNYSGYADLKSIKNDYGRGCDYNEIILTVGNWIVRKSSGKIVVMEDEEFQRKYAPCG